MKPPRDLRRSRIIKGLEMPQSRGKTSVFEISIIALALFWILFWMISVLLGDSDEQGSRGLARVLLWSALIVPPILLAALLLIQRQLRRLRIESEKMHERFEALSQAFASGTPSQMEGDISAGEVKRKLDTIETALRNLSSVAEPQHINTAPKHSPKSADEAQTYAAQTALDLADPVKEPTGPLANAELISALNFPDDEHDKLGFAAVRKTMAHREPARLLRAAQDILTLMSQDGIYMDDLLPSPARPSDWRKFSEGIRGREITSVGAITDRSSLALCAGRMKQDPIFRDAAHHFMRRFDDLLTELAPNLTDGELTALANTRSARAFMLLGRVAGTFD